jgi:hypothetical protein
VDKENKVRILNENLEFVLNESNYKSADVNVEYTIINDGQESDIYIVFTYLGGDDIKAFIDGKEIKYEFQKRTGISVNTRGDTVKFQDSSGGVSYTLDSVMDKVLNEEDNPDGDDPDGYSVRAAFFKVPLKHGTEQILKFTYKQWAGEIKPPGFLRSKEYNFDYLIEPAKYWSGFQGFNLTIKSPKDAKIAGCTFDLTKTTDNSFNTYTYKSDSLPDKNLRFSIDSGIKDPYESILLIAAAFLLVFVGAVVLITLLLVKASNKRKAMKNNIQRCENPIKR